VPPELVGAVLNLMGRMNEFQSPRTSNRGKKQDSVWSVVAPSSTCSRPTTTGVTSEWYMSKQQDVLLARDDLRSFVESNHSQRGQHRALNIKERPCSRQSERGRSLQIAGGTIATL